MRRLYWLVSVCLVLGSSATQSFADSSRGRFPTPLVRKDNCWISGRAKICDDFGAAKQNFVPSKIHTKHVLVLVDPVFMEDTLFWTAWGFLACALQDRNPCDDQKKLIRSQIDQYVLDIQNEGMQVTRINVASTDLAYKNPKALHQLIRDVYQKSHIEGVVLIGKFPYALLVQQVCERVFTARGTVRCKDSSDPLIYYTDLVLGDMDGNWDKAYTTTPLKVDTEMGPAKLKSYYLLDDLDHYNIEHSKKDLYFASPELWVSRIDAERAIGGMGFNDDTGAIPTVTLANVTLQKGVAYRIRTSWPSLVESSQSSTDLPLIQTIHDAETSDEVGSLPHFGIKVLTAVKKSGAYQVVMNLQGDRGSWIKAKNFQKNPVLVVERISLGNKTGSPYTVDQIVPLTTKMNQPAAIEVSKQLTLVSNYFSRNHLFRTKKWDPKANMIRLNDGEFFDQAQEKFQLLASEGVTQPSTMEAFDRNVYLSQLFASAGTSSQGVPMFGKTYKYGTLMIHSYEGGHAFHKLMPEEDFTYADMSSMIQLADQNSAANILFFVNHGCMNSNIDPATGHPDTGSVYLFRFGGLVHFGLSFLGGNGFYEQVTQTFLQGGDAGKGYLNSVRAQEQFITQQIEAVGENQYMGRKRTYYTVLLGDGTLRSQY